MNILWGMIFKTKIIGKIGLLLLIYVRMIATTEPSNLVINPTPIPSDLQNYDFIIQTLSVYSQSTGQKVTYKTDIEEVFSIQKISTTSRNLRMLDSTDTQQYVIVYKGDKPNKGVYNYIFTLTMLGPSQEILGSSLVTVLVSGSMSNHPET